MAMLGGAYRRCSDVALAAAGPSASAGREAACCSYFRPDDTNSAIRSSVVAFAQGMRTAGWTAGANVGLDYRLAAQILNARPRLPAEAADLKPTV